MMKFITVMDTVFQGRVAAWRDEDGKPVLYDTLQEAELDAADSVMEEGDVPDDILVVEVTDDQIVDPVDGRVYWTKGEEQ